MKKEVATQKETKGAPIATRVTVFVLLLPAVEEDARGVLRENFLPELNLPGMDFAPGGQLGHCLLAFQCLQRHLGLEGRAVFPAAL